MAGLLRLFAQAPYATEMQPSRLYTTEGAGLGREGGKGKERIHVVTAAPRWR